MRWVCICHTVVFLTGLTLALRYSHDLQRRNLRSGTRRLRDARLLTTATACADSLPLATRWIPGTRSVGTYLGASACLHACCLSPSCGNAFVSPSTHPRRTPLHVAAVNGNVRCVCIARMRGAVVNTGISATYGLGAHKWNTSG